MYSYERARVPRKNQQWNQNASGRSGHQKFMQFIKRCFSTTDSGGGFFVCVCREGKGGAKSAPNAKLAAGIMMSAL
jgi:hypothetical protein